MTRSDRTVDHGLRLLDRGACVPWDAMAIIDRAQADAAASGLLHRTDREASRGIIRRLRDRLTAGRHRESDH